MNATYNITNNRLFFWPDSRLPEAEYKACKSAGFVWWPRGCFTAIWSPSAEDWIKAQGVEIDQDDTPDDVEARVNRFERYAENDEQTAASANNRLISGTANTARRIAQAESTALSKTEEARYWHDRIAGAIAHAEHHDRPDVIARRIKGLEADFRRQSKILAAHKAQSVKWNINPITREQALYLANWDDCDYSHCFMKSEYPNSTYEGMKGIWSALTDNTITPEQARDISIKDHTQGIQNAERWVNHLTMRLEYEKSYLEAAGGSELLAPKPRRVSKAPADGLHKGDTVRVGAFLAGKCMRWDAQIISMGAVSVCVTYPPGFLKLGSTWGAKGIRLNRNKVEKVS